jgi:CNT family concentrative nucleoside transporter
MMYYLGVMQWVIGKLYGIRTLMYFAANTICIHSAWFFFKIMAVSGAEAVVAAASPWVGQGESACLVRPYVDCKHSSSHPHIKTPFHPYQHSDDRI